jgi:hypothetical protein
MTRSSASNALSAISASVSSCGRRWSAPTKVVRLAAGQEEVARIAERIERGVELGAHSAARSGDRLVFSSIFWAPALC